MNDENTRKGGDSVIPIENKAPERKNILENHIIEPENALPEVTLEELPERVRKAAARAGWTKLMPVQAKAIPYILAGRDLMIQSRTGSGKTGAYILPILERIDQSRSVCQVLILVPTRELARQVTQEAETLSGGTRIHTVAAYGGVGYGPQIQAFRTGAHLVVGTPGRILDHLLKGSLSLKHLKILILDEADRMLSMGFYPDMKEVQGYLPSRRINGYMFSATFPPHVIRLAAEFLQNPEFLSLSSDRVHVAETEHVYYVVPAMKKDRCLVRIIEIENPTSALIFCNTRAEVHYVTVVLQRFGYDADELSSDLSQGARESIMTRVRKGALRFLVATDVAARGIDLPELSHVILYEPPEDHEIYIHRAGRTGRAGAGGVAISLVSGLEQMELTRIAKRYGIDMQERPLPSEADVEAIVSQRVTVLLEARLRSRDTLQTERMQRFVPLGQSLAQSEDESAIIAMLLDDYYQQTLHAPPTPPRQPKRSGRTTASDSDGKRKKNRHRTGRRRRKKQAPQS
ncbi:MAG: DEAD/DEAH box helicase [Gemmatimonadota bacterium]|nr:MAG: DEAD/DEAH box helicase [Gemmatimonadota bacterium]